MLLKGTWKQVKTIIAKTKASNIAHKGFLK